MRSGIEGRWIARESFAQGVSIGEAREIIQAGATHRLVTEVAGEVVGAGGPTGERGEQGTEGERRGEIGGRVEEKRVLWRARTWCRQ